MDLDDDLDGPIQAPTRRPSRFLPKSIKPKQEPKLEPVTKSEPQELDLTLVFNNKETKPVISESPNNDVTTSIANGVAKMEVDSSAEVQESKKDAMEIDEVEDCVVREIDVYYTPSVDDNTQIYVLEYPLRPCWRPYELEERCEEVRVKPKGAEVEVDLAVDVYSENYDATCGNNKRMTKQTLTSSWKPPHCTGYAIGILKGNKLHLNPIRAAVQLRPSMEHLKVGEEECTKEHTGSSKKQNKLIGSLNEQNTGDKEHWIPLKYYGPNSDFSARYLQKLVAEESCSIQFSMSPYDYLNSLCPLASDNNVNSKGLSKRFLLSLPLEERLKKWLCEGDAQVHRFNSLKHLAPDVSTDDILEVLQLYAVLVQGMWVPKSSLLYSKDPGKGNQQLARDYVLLMFSQNPTIKYSQLEVPMKFKGDLRGFLNKFAVERPNMKDWKFKVATDLSFIKLYEGIVQKQQSKWDSMKEKVVNSVHGKTGDGIINSMNSGMDKRLGSSRISDQGAAKASSGSVTRKMTMANETREALPKALDVLFKNHSVYSFQMICQGLRDLAVSTSTVPKADPRMFVVAANGADAPPEELQAVISQVAFDIHGVYVSKSSSKYPEYNPLREVIINLLRVRGPDAKLKKAEIFEAAKIALKRSITPNEYSKVMYEICEYRGAAWVLKSGNGKPK